MSPVESLEEYLRLLRALAPLGHAYVMGGFAEDALLHGSVTRPLSDADLLVEPDGWAELWPELESIGVGGFETVAHGPGGEPLAYGCRAGGIELEAWLSTRDQSGYAIVLPGGPPRAFRLRLPTDTFDCPASLYASLIEGIPVRTVSPHALCLLRAASALTRGARRSARQTG